MILGENPNNDMEVRRLKSLLGQMTTKEDYRYVREQIQRLKQSDDTDVKTEHQVVECGDDRSGI